MNEWMNEWMNEQSMLVMVSGDISWITEFIQELELQKNLEITFA